MRFVRLQVVGWCLFAVIVVVLGFTLPLYWVFLLSTVAVSALVARSVGVVTNQAGMMTLCQMSFAAIGGWVVSWLSLVWPSAPFPLLVVVAAVTAAPVGLLIAVSTMRIRGVELAVVTLGFAAALDLVIGRMSFPGAGEGIPVLPSAPFGDPRMFFALAWGALFLAQLLLWRVSRTPLGLSWTAVRVSERATAALGVRVGPAKLSAFSLGAGLAGGAGALLAGQYGLLTAEVFAPLTSLVHFAAAVMTGAGIFGGALLAGVLAVLMPEVLRRLGIPLDVGNALFAIGAIDILRRGEGGIADQLSVKLQDRRFRDVRTQVELDAPLPASSPTALERAGATALSVAGLDVSFGANRVLHGVHLEIERGQVHALIGPNGAGKSTLVDAVTGFLPTYGGVVAVDGRALEGLAARDRARAGLRRTFQQSRAIEAMNVGDYLRLAAGRAGTTRIDDVSAYFGLPGHDVPVRLMDIGSRRVLEIAAALAAEPKVLLLDEPASGLSDAESAGLARRIHSVPARFGCAVLLIEHDMSFVRQTASTATVLDYGEQICTGPVAEVMADPRVIAAYLGEEVTA